MKTGEFGVWCRDLGEVFADRKSSWLKANGVVQAFDTHQSAAREAQRLTDQMSSNPDRKPKFKYSAQKFPPTNQQKAAQLAAMASIVEADKRQIEQWGTSRADAKGIARIVIDVPRKFLKRIEAECIRRGVPIDDAIRELLDREFGKKRKRRF